MTDVVEAGPSRSGRGWAVAAALVLALLVAMALRGNGGTPDAAPTPTVPATPTERQTEVPAPPRPTPRPRLTGAPGPKYRLVVAAETSVRRNGLVEYRTPADHRIDSFTPLRGGWAAVVTEDPVRTANPWKLVVRNGGRDRTITVDERTVVLPGATGDSFWTARPEGHAQRRDARGAVVTTERVPAPWHPVGATAEGLVLQDDEGRRVGLWRRGRAEVLVRNAAFSAATPTRIAVLEGLCAAACSVGVHDVRTRASWVRRLPPGPVYLDIELDPSGRSAAVLAAFSGGTAVYVAEERSDFVAEVATTPQDSASLVLVEWVAPRLLGVVDVADDLRSLLYDVGSRSLLVSGTYEHPGNVVAVFADLP